VAVLREQAHGFAAALHAKAVAIVLDFMNQSGPDGTTSAVVGRQNSNAVRMALK
jgi:hypothetical protein